MDIAGHWGIPLFAGSTSIITQGGAKYPRWTFWWPNASFWPSFGYWPWKITLRSYLSVDSHMGIRSHMLDFGNPRFPVSRIPIWESCCFRIPIWESGDLQLQMLGNWAAVLWKTKEKLCYNRVQKLYTSNTNCSSRLCQKQMQQICVPCICTVQTALWKGGRNCKQKVNSTRQIRFS